MFNKELLLIVTITIAFTHQTIKTDSEIPVSFRKVGNLAAGLSYAHIHGTLDFAKLKEGHDHIEEYLRSRILEATNQNEEAFLSSIQTQLQVSKKTIQRLDFAFFKNVGKREKRQLLMGLSLGLGFVSAGMSVYNTIEIYKLHREIKDVKAGFKYVAHVLEEDHNAILALSKSITEIKKMCRTLLEFMKNEVNEVHMTQRMLLMTSMVQNHNNEVAALARGLEALLFNQLYPTLIDSTKLQKGLQVISEMAKTKGLKLLNEDASNIYKNAISFVSTVDRKILIFIHVPLVHFEPIDLYEHLAIPFQMGDLLVTLESKNQFLATDKSGQLGMELSNIDLLHCQMEKSHFGNTYICPNTNLVRNNVRKTCLGALLYGHKVEIIANCQTYVQRAAETQEFAMQTGSNKFLILAKENLSVVKFCKNGTQIMNNITGLTTISTDEDCRIVTENHTFRPQIDLDLEVDFIDRPIVLEDMKILQKVEIKDLEQAYKQLASIKIPTKTHIDDLKQWIHSTQEVERTSLIGSSLSSMGIIISLVAVFVLAYLFCSYRKSKNETSSEK